MKRICALILAVVLSLSLMPMALAATTFTDINDVSANAKDAIAFCSDHGFIRGYSATRFGPTENLTRGQFAIVWGRVMQLIEHTFSDVTKLKSWDDTVINILYALDIVNGASSTRFDRNSSITREQAATVVARCYKLVPKDSKKYKDYTDHADISSWAQDAVSTCKEFGLLTFVTGATFMPQKAITRAELCQIIYELNTYMVSIDPAITGGTITAAPMKAEVGETVTVAINPANTSKRLKPGSLKYYDAADPDDITPITGTTFKMPGKNIVITGVFESVPVLQSIAVTKMPTKTTYTKDDTLDITGLEVTATYTDTTTAVIPNSSLGIDPTTLDTVGDPVTITVTYIESIVSKSTTFDVVVNAPAEGGGPA